MGFVSIAPGLDRVCVPLVHLAGLDVKLPEHKTIHDTLRSAQTGVNYMFVPVDQCYPVAKQKKENLDLFIPDGALKANWMVKQLEVIPSVLCFFVTLEFDDPNISSKLQEVKSKLDIVRMSLKNRKTSITMCLIQKEPVEPSQEVIVEMEKTLELNRTSIFILPLKNDHLSGYVQRLQNWLLQLSHNYYDAEIMEVKMRQELNASRMHPLLYCRYLFKLAFYCEIRHLTGDAITFYKHCYTRLTSESVQVTPQNQSQVIALATLVNFKLVKLYLTVAPWFQRDYAQKQLDKHVHYWSQGTLKGPTELWFEYYAWVAAQYRVYGDLLAESANGLRVNGQAAFYYLKAAKFERDRAEFIRQIKAQVLQQECPKNDITAANPVYLGERVWRNDGIHGEMDKNAEMIAMFIMQFKECNLDHSLQITKTLNKANAEFKNYGYTRFRPHLLIMMVEEYLRTEGHEAKQRALTLIYKCYELLDSSWLDIHVKCHELMYKCATDLGDFAKASIALANLIGATKLPSEQRLQYHRAFNDVASKLADSVIITNTRDLMIGTTFHFARQSVLFGDEIELVVTLRNNAPGNVTITSIVGKFNIDTFNSMLTLAEPLTLVAGASHTLRFAVTASAEMIDKTLQLEGVTVDVGNVKFAFDRQGQIETGHLVNMTSSLSMGQLHVGPVEKTRMTRQSTKIVAPQARAMLTFADDKVIHVGEVIKMSVSFTIEDEMENGVKLIIQTNKESLIEKTQEDLLMKDPCQHLTYELTGTSGAVDFYVKHTNEGAESERASLLVAQLQYKAVTGEMSFTTSKRAESRLMVIKPLQIASKCASDLLKPLLATPRLDQFILSLIKIESATTIPISIDKMVYEQNKFLSANNNDIDFNALELERGDSCQGAFFLKQTGHRDPKSSSIDLGKIRVWWRRIGSVQQFNHVAPLGYLPVHVATDGIGIRSSVPPVITLHEPFALKLSVRNETDTLLSVHAQLIESEHIKVASSLKMDFTLVPGQKDTDLEVVLMPLMATWCDLPKVTVTYTTGAGDLSTYDLSSELPSRVFVKSTTKSGDLARIIHSPIKI